MEKITKLTAKFEVEVWSWKQLHNSHKSRNTENMKMLIFDEEL